MVTAKSPGRMASNLAGRVWRTHSLSVPLREVQSYFPGWSLLSPSTHCQMVNVTLQDCTACSSWRMWFLVSPWHCSLWSLLAARLMRFQMSTSITRSKRCSSSTTTFVSSILRSGGWMLPRCWWQGLFAKCDFSRHVDNELAFFSVYSDSSMDMSHLIRNTHNKITSGSEINIDTQVPYSMLDRSLHVHIPLWGAKCTPQAAVRWSGIIHPHRQESTIVACMETSMYNYMHTRNGVYITELHRELQAKVQYCILTKYSHFQTTTPC